MIRIRGLKIEVTKGDREATPPRLRTLKVTHTPTGKTCVVKGGRPCKIARSVLGSAARMYKGVVTPQQFQRLCRLLSGTVPEGLAEASYHVGEWVHQPTGRRFVKIDTWGVITKILKNGAPYGVVCQVEARRVGKAKKTSMGGWHPEPRVVSRDEVPPKVRKKIEQFWAKGPDFAWHRYGGVSEGAVCATAVYDVIESGDVEAVADQVIEAEKKKFWIKQAIQHKGALRRQLKTKAGEVIPAKKLKAAAKKKGKIGRRARLAITLKKFH